MKATVISTTPFIDQRPGTSGLRKKTRVFMGPHYLENFVQSVFQALSDGQEHFFCDKTLVVGGDGRFYNRQAIQTIIKMAAANGFGRVLVGQGGIASTPAVSAVIRTQQAFGGFVLSASHNPGGIEHDFGIKYNISNGGPAPEPVTEKVFAVSKKLQEYRILMHPDLNLDALSSHQLNGTEVRIFDPVLDYTAVMRRIFDFDRLRELFRGGFKLRFDAMHAVTGPYARHIFEELLGAPAGTVLNGIPLEDFADGHPDPNQVHAKSLIELLNRDPSITLGAASDGDGDRNMIIGPKFFVTPGDSLAIITEYARHIPGYSGGIAGVARSMPTSTAVDRVAAALGVRSFETPTGWKFFGSLMDAGLCTICGEESFGTGSNHVREKDGLWAVLCWLSILAHSKSSVPEVVQSHWQKFGRCYYQRHDYEGLESGKAQEMFSSLRSKVISMAGMTIGGRRISHADDYAYTDPVDGSSTSKQGIRLLFDEDSRIICRLSGTGTEGATLRVYFESYRQDGGMDEPGEVLAQLIQGARELLQLKERFGSDQPTVIT